MYKIISKEMLNSTVEKMVVEAPFIAKKCGAGQFLMVMVEEDGERIPLTIAEISKLLLLFIKLLDIQQNYLVKNKLEILSLL